MEDWNKVKARGKRSSLPLARIVQLIVLVGLEIELNATIIQPFLRPPAPTVPTTGDPSAMELAHLKMLAHGLKLHATSTTGNFPRPSRRSNGGKTCPL